MASLKPDPITLPDVKEYSEGYADFGFEMQVLNKFSSLSFDCNHSGTYEDPVTRKTRQFDIRAKRTVDGRTLSLAVECKNLRENYPLVIHAVQRQEHEGFHQIILHKSRVIKNTNIEQLMGNVSGYTNSVVWRVNAPGSQYQIGTYVGKAMDQVGRDTNGDLKNGDAEVFEKCSQAINSTLDLIDAAYRDGTGTKAYAILPILVVPDGRIWQISYKPNGEVAGDPTQVSSAQFYVGKEWKVGGDHWLKYTISHLDIVTFSSIEKFVTDYLSNSVTTGVVFPYTPAECSIRVGH